VARGTQHLKRRPREDARSRVVAASPATAGRKKKQKPPQWQEELFFARLRAHAKWVFVLLAVAFGLGFVIFGVGSGSTGISDALQNAFNFGSSGTSISSLEKKVVKHPEDPAAWRSLATAYETKQRTQDAINALERFTALKPKDADALGELASEYAALVQSSYTAYQNGLALNAVANPSSQFQPAASSPFGKAFGSTTALKSPIDAAVEEQATANISNLSQNLSSAEQLTVSTYQRLAKLTPKDATVQLQLGQYAEASGQSTVAIAAFKKFLQLAPTDVEAATVRKDLKALLKSTGASTTTPSG
jgi:tetratricopeptide (TPR) repeat protein